MFSASGRSTVDTVKCYVSSEHSWDVCTEQSFLGNFVALQHNIRGSLLVGPRLLGDCGIHTRMCCLSLSEDIVNFSNYVGVLTKFFGIQKGSLKKLGTIALDDKQLFPWKCDFKFILSKFQETPACSATYITHFRGLVYMKQCTQFHIQNFISLSFSFLC